MGWWAIPGDVLARLRFATSPMAEVVGALGDLDRNRRAIDRVFAARHRDAFEDMLREHPGRRAVFEHCSRPGWLADFLGIPPPSVAPTFEDELRQVSALSEDEFVEQLRQSTPSVLPPILEESGVSQHVLGLLEWTWTHTIATDWPRRERVLHADIVARTHRLAEHGFAGVLRDLGKRRVWADGHFRINEFDLPIRHLPRTAQLTLVPAHSIGSLVGWDLPDRFAIYYAVAGELAGQSDVRPGGVGRLLGQNRARLLRSLDTPQTTSTLAVVSGLPIGAVGNHLRILLDAGVVLKRRSGREVLYWRTALGDELLAASR